MVAVLVGIALALPLSLSLIVGGVLVLALAVAAERIALSRPAAPLNGRRATNSKGGV